MIWVVYNSIDEARQFCGPLSDFESDDKLFSGLSAVDGKLNVGKASVLCMVR